MLAVFQFCKLLSETSACRISYSSFGEVKRISRFSDSPRVRGNKRPFKQTDKNKLLVVFIWQMEQRMEIHSVA